MNLKKITSSTISLIVVAIFIFAVGAYTDNNGFQFAGGIILVVALITAFKQSRKQDTAD